MLAVCSAATVVAAKVTIRAPMTDEIAECALDFKSGGPTPNRQVYDIVNRFGVMRSCSFLSSTGISRETNVGDL